MSRHNATGQFIRGGQTTQHWFRMAVQVLRYAIFVMIGVSALVLAAWVVVHYDNEKFVKSRYWVLSRINIYRAMPEFPLRVALPDGTVFTRPSSEIYRAQDFRDAYYDLERKSVEGLWLAGQAGLAFGAFSFAIFFAAGRKLGTDEHIRGAQLVPVKALKTFSAEKWRKAIVADKARRTEPRYTMGGLEFPPDALVAQTGIFGTTGAGKTTLIKDLIFSIRAAGGHALIYDRTGEYTSAFYDDSRDVIVNPFDARSHCWSPFNDAKTAEGFTQIYDVLIPSPPGERDPFWSKSARIVAEFVSRELVKRGRGTNADLRDALMHLPIDKLEQLIQQTPAENFIGEQTGKMGTSVYASLLASLRFLEYLRDDGPRFSARDWVRSIFKDGPRTIDGQTGEVTSARPADASAGASAEGSFVFLTGHPEFDAATRNITSAIMEIAATALMGCAPSRAPKLFFIIDELATLNRLPFLTGKLAEVRKVGGCFVVGFQVLSQLEDIYGREGANTVMGNLNNTIFGSTPDHTTAEKFSKALGMADQIESRENISVGANENRDGVGFIKNRFERPIATPTQIMRLPQLKAYFTFAYDSPTALVSFKPSKIRLTELQLVPYTGSGFGTGTLDGDRFAESAAFCAAPPHKLAAEFRAWLKTYEQGLGDAAPRLSDADMRALWAHYATERIAGNAPEVIGPPALDPALAVTVEAAARTNEMAPHAYGGEQLPPEAFDPTRSGPRIILAGGPTWTDEARAWNLLDQVFYRHNSMVLCHRAMKGAELIGADWALDRGVPQIVFRPKFDLHGEKAVDIALDAMFARDVKGVLFLGGFRDAARYRAKADALRINVKVVEPPAVTMDLPDYPLQASPNGMCATPAASPEVTPVSLAGPRRTLAGGTPDKKKRVLRLRKREPAPPRERNAPDAALRGRETDPAAMRCRIETAGRRQSGATPHAQRKARNFTG